MEKVGSTKEDLEMQKILRDNKIKMQQAYKVNAKKEKLLNGFMIVSSSIFFIGLMYLIYVIENLKF